jgi:hypothetical protein
MIAAGAIPVCLSRYPQQLMHMTIRRNSCGGATKQTCTGTSPFRNAVLSACMCMCFSPHKVLEHAVLSLNLCLYCSCRDRVLLRPLGPLAGTHK